MTEIDLQPFCGRDKNRPYLMKPFSMGDFTYATDGAILARVPRRSDVEENEDAPRVDKLIGVPAAAKFESVAGIVLPPPGADGDACPSCYGSGKEHDCPDCKCVCDDCGGTGKEQPLRSVSIDGRHFDAKYIAMMLALPAIEVMKNPRDGDPALFRFDGGIGVLMPLRVGPMSKSNDLGDIEAYRGKGAP